MAGHLGYLNEQFQQLWISMSPEFLPPSLVSIRQRSGADVVQRISLWLPWRPSWYRDIKILAILTLHVSPMPTNKFRLNPICDSGDVGCLKKLTMNRRTTDNKPWHELNWCKAPGELTIENLQGGHLEYRNKILVAILKLYVAQTMPPTNFCFNPTYHLGADEVWRCLRWSLWLPSWILEQNDFSNSESLRCSDAFHKVSAQSNWRLGGVIIWRISG